LSWSEHRSLAASGALLVAGYAWIASGFQPFTRPSLIAIVGGGIVAIVAGAQLRLGVAPREAASPPRGAWSWAVLAAATSAWELQSFLQHPRHDHPTLSSLTNILLASHPARALALVAWLAAAVWLARR
jgi:hypothetical protein